MFTRSVEFHQEKIKKLSIKVEEINEEIECHLSEINKKTMDNVPESWIGKIDSFTIVDCADFAGKFGRALRITFEGVSSKTKFSEVYNVIECEMGKFKPILDKVLNGNMRFVPGDLIGKNVIGTLEKKMNDYFTIKFEGYTFHDGSKDR